MRPSERGFTLIELLIAIALVALTTLMLAGGVRMVAGHVGGREAGLDQSAKLTAVDDFLRAEFADARPLPTPAGAASFDGRPDGVTFVSSAPESLTTAGLLNLSLVAAPAMNAMTGLKLMWRPYRETALAGSGAAERMLLDHLAQVRFAYFGSARTVDAPQWQDTWSGMSSLPMLVRLRMTLANGEELPDLVIALRLSPGSGDLRNARRRF
ncbi:MAG: ral secretion pathway protein [Rhodospirillales bacterium]|jgi:general secretion pathway protein J|nr:ral secretion pathway protein [Rhodospirillales bacterium]